MANLSRFVLPFADVGAGIRPSSGAKLFFFDTGTSTPKDTFSDSAGTTPNANPVIADSKGVFPDIFFIGTFKVILKDRNDVQVWEADPVDSFLSASFIDGLNPNTLADAISDKTLNNGDVLHMKERISGNDGGGIWDVVLTSTVTPNGLNVVQSTAAPSISLVIRGLSSVDIKLWGCVCDLSTDDTLAFQNAVDQAGLILIHENLHYKQDVTIPSNTTIQGLKPKTTIKGNMTPEGGGSGGFPVTLFTNSDTINGNQNIKFININFDFAKGAFNYLVGAGLTEKAGLKFENVDSLSFENCTFFDYVTNLNTSLAINKEFGMMYLQNCNQIRIRDIETQKIREEAINAWECNNLSIENWSGNGTVVGTSSFGGFWYCEGLSIANASFIHSGGSVLNCYSRNVVYDNIKVNAGLSPNGRGFDFGNEPREQRFNSNNIEVRNCEINTVQYGITFLRFTGFSDIIDNVLISNNKITVTEETGRPSILGISPSISHTIEISNNTINTSHVTDIIDIGIALIGLDGLSLNSDVNILNNTIGASNAISASVSAGDSGYGSITVQNNTFESSDIGSLSSFGGAATFFHLRGTSGAGAYNIDNINISGNTAKNCAGAFTHFTFDTAAGAIKNIQVSSNYAESDGTPMERQSFGFPVKLAGNTVQVIDNTFLDCGTISVVNAEHVRIINNQAKHTVELGSKSITMIGSPDYVDITDNRFYNVSSSPLTVDSDLLTPKIGNVVRNYAERGAGTSFFSNALTNTTLPN